jgi:hypothetical protein
LFQIQHCSPAFPLHLHYSDDSNEEGAEFEVDGYSPCQQSSPTPSFQISESGLAEFSEEEQIQRQQFLDGPLVSPSYGPYDSVAEEKH